MNVAVPSGQRGDLLRARAARCGRAARLISPASALGAVAAGELLERALGDRGRGDLGAEVAERHPRDAHVGADDLEDRLDRLARVVEPEPGQPEPLLEDLGVVAGAEPGTRPPTSPWWAVVVAKPISRSSRNDGLKTKMSCRWIPPSNGIVDHEDVAGPHAVAPLGRVACSSRAGPSRGGRGPSPPARPSRRRASQSAAEKSMPSRTTVEWAVRKIVVAISSAIEASALATICWVTGSGRRCSSRSLQDRGCRSSRRAAPSSRAARRPSCRTRR